MKIFVTVGTTPFPRLIETIKKIHRSEDELVVQCACAAEGNSDIQFFTWIEGVDKYFDWADIVICHAGAGTIYNLLEKRKKIIVVPNLDRVDPHQNEISNYIEKNNYGLVCRNLNDLTSIIHAAMLTTFDIYTKKDFFMQIEIIRFIKKQLT